MSKRWLVSFLAVCALIGSSSTFGQSTQNQDITLEIRGVQLALGMDFDAFLAKLSEAKLQAFDYGSQVSTPGGFFCHSSDHNREVVLGTYALENGKVVMITKRWADNTKTAQDLLSAFYGIAADFQKRGINKCTIKARQHLEPHSEFKCVDLLCGPYRRLSLILGINNSQTTYPVIEEVLSLVPLK